MNSTKSALEKARAELDLLEAQSEAAFKAWRTAYYRTAVGELTTYRALNAAMENMEFAVIRAGNAYRALRQQG
jgi:hypothetical protein